MGSEVQLVCWTCQLRSAEEIGCGSRHSATIGHEFVGVMLPPLALVQIAHAEAGHLVKIVNLDYYYPDAWTWGASPVQPPKLPEMSPVADWPRALPKAVIRWVDRPAHSSCTHADPCDSPMLLDGPPCPMIDGAADSDLCEVCPRNLGVKRIGDTRIKYVVCADL